MNMNFTITKMEGGKYTKTKEELINFILYQLDNNDRRGWSHVILKGNMSSVFYLDIDKLIELGLKLSKLLNVIKQVLIEYYGDNVDLSMYLLKSVGYYKFHIYFYNIIVSKNIGFQLICEVNRRINEITKTDINAVDTLNKYSNTLRFEGCYKYDKDTKTYPTNTNYVLIKGILNRNFYTNIFKYGEKETPLIKELPVACILIKPHNNKSSNKPSNKPATFNYSTNTILHLVKATGDKDKSTVEITCKEDILKCIPNTGKYYQPFEVWWSIGVACKRVGISRKIFEDWTGENANGWDKWNVNKKGFALNFLMSVARKCANVVNGIYATDFLKSDTMKPNISYNERYCRCISVNDMNDLPDYISKYTDNKTVNVDNKAIIMQAVPGTGKSTITFDIMNKYEWNSILVLTPRRTYAHGIYNMLKKQVPQYNFSFYQHDNISNSKYVICSMESLYKLGSIPTDFELVIIDEVESNLYQFSSSTMKKLADCSFVFEEVVKNAKHILALDGFINPNRSIKLFKNLNIDYTFIRNEYKYDNLNINCVDWKKDDIISFLKDKILNQNKKVYAVITRKTWAQQIYNALHESFLTNTTKGGLIFVKDQDDKTITTHSTLSNPKYIEIYHGDLPDKDKIVHNVNEEWSKVDLVITTLSITVGLDYTNTDYDIGICFADCQSGLARDCVQSMLRMRKLTKWYLILNGGAFTGFAPVISKHYCSLENKKNIITNFIKTCEKYKQKDNRKPNIENHKEWLVMPDWLQDLYFTNVYENQISKLYYKILLQHFLNVVGFKIYNYDYNYIKITADLPAFNTINDIDSNTVVSYKNLLNTYDLTGLEWYELAKYDLLHSAFSGDYDKLWKLWIKKRKHFKNILVELQDDIWSVYYNNIEKFEFIERTDLHFKQYHIIKQFKTLFGWENTLDYTWKITGKDLDSVLEKILHNDRDYSRIFQVKPARAGDMDRKKGLEMINKYLTSWSVNKIVRLRKVRKTINKVQVNMPDLYEYGLDRSLNLTYIKATDTCSIVEDD